MTKEELKQEAEEKAKKRTKGFKCQDNCEKSYVMGALDFAEPRERRIEELEAQNEDWKSDHEYNLGLMKGLNKQISDLEAQIEKMKCCQNCRKFNNLSYDCTCAEVCNEWELRR